MIHFLLGLKWQSSAEKFAIPFVMIVIELYEFIFYCVGVWYIYIDVVYLLDLSIYLISF